MPSDTTFNTAYNIYDLLKRVGFNPKLKRVKNQTQYYVEVVAIDKKEVEGIKRFWGNMVSVSSERKRTAVGDTFYLVRIKPKTKKSSSKKNVKRTSRSKTRSRSRTKKSTRSRSQRRRSRRR